MKIYFVRHGQSTSNVDDREQGPDSPLTPLGKQQAEFVAKRFNDIPITRIIASPYVRAHETAEIIAAHLKKEIEYSELYVERRPVSEMIGKPGSSPEYQAIRKISEEKRRIDPSWKYSDEESFTELKARAKAALVYLIEQDADHALVVTHGGFLKTMISYMVFGDALEYGTYVDMFNTFKTKNTGITVAEYKVDPNPFIGGWDILAWNDHAHL